MLTSHTPDGILSSESLETEVLATRVATDGAQVRLTHFPTSVLSARDTAQVLLGLRAQHSPLYQLTLKPLSCLRAAFLHVKRIGLDQGSSCLALSEAVVPRAQV